MVWWSSVWSGHGKSRKSPPPYPTGFIWLVNGCSISTYTTELTAKLVQKFAPELCVHNAYELWDDYDYRHKYSDYNVSTEDGRINLVEAMRRDNATFHFCKPGQTPFVVAKVETANIRSNRTNDFDHIGGAPLPFAYASVIRENIPEYLACLLRDQNLHYLKGVRQNDIGYLVDAETGEPWEHRAGVFRSDKLKTSVVLNTHSLTRLFDHVLAEVTLPRKALLEDAGVGATVYATEHLVDFSTPSKLRAAADIWVSLLARAGVYVSLDDAVDVLALENPSPPCDLRSRIYNLNEVRDALRHTIWERFVYCPDEWNYIHGAGSVRHHSRD